MTNPKCELAKTHYAELSARSLHAQKLERALMHVSFEHGNDDAIGQQNGFSK